MANPTNTCRADNRRHAQVAQLRRTKRNGNANSLPLTSLGIGQGPHLPLFFFFPFLTLDAKMQGYSLANNTTDSIYGVLSADPSRALRFAGAMKTYSLGSGHHTSYIVDHYPWGSLPRTTTSGSPTQTTRVVDMGGGRGHIAMALAKRFDNLTFLIQDIPQIVDGADADVPESLRNRIRFAPHDMFAPQTAEADVYYLRWILHNWSDKYCRLILQALIPALKKGARVLVQDTCMPEPGDIPLWREKDLRAADLNMAAVFNARERTVDEWRELFSGTDSRFVLNQVIEPKGSALGILEFLWDEGMAA